MRFRLASPEKIAKQNAASAEEKLRRDFAFLGLNYDICGVDVRVMTVRDWLSLMVARSPFLVGGEVTPGHIAAFLWLLSPQYTTNDHKQSYWFPDSQEIEWMTPREFFVESIQHLDAVELERGIEEYCDFIFHDSPSGGGPSRMPIASFAASIVDRFSTKWSQEEILSCQVPRIFQFMRLEDRAAGGPAFNRSTDITAGKFLRMLKKLPLEQRQPIMDRFNSGEEVELPDSL